MAAAFGQALQFIQVEPLQMLQAQFAQVGGQVGPGVQVNPIQRRLLWRGKEGFLTTAQVHLPIAV